MLTLACQEGTGERLRSKEQRNFFKAVQTESRRGKKG